MKMRHLFAKVSPKIRIREGAGKVLMRELFDFSLDIDRMTTTLFGKKSKSELMYKQLRKNKFQTHSLVTRGRK